MLFRIGVAGLVAAMASSAQGQTKTITRPDWQQLPTAESLAEHYPQAGRMLDIEGYARVSCTVAASGALTDCKVDFEAPKDLGFGQAALAMSSEFRMRPQLVNGQPVAGGTVTVPIRFKLPTAEPLTLPPEPRSPEALKEGQRLVDAVGSVDLAMRKYDDEARLIETTAEGSRLRGGARRGRRSASPGGPGPPPGPARRLRPRLGRGVHRGGDVGHHCV
jgi:TonB family protein